MLENLRNSKHYKRNMIYFFGLLIDIISFSTNNFTTNPKFRKLFVNNLTSTLGLLTFLFHKKVITNLKITKIFDY